MLTATCYESETLPLCQKQHKSMFSFAPVGLFARKAEGGRIFIFLDTNVLCREAAGMRKKIPLIAGKKCHYSFCALQLHKDEQCALFKDKCSPCRQTEAKRSQTRNP